MDRVPVSSSMLTSIGFEKDDDTIEEGTLEVEFTNGKVAQYSEVPESVFDALMSAPSIGQAFSGLVKNAGFAWEYV